MHQSGIKDEENREVTDFIYKLYFMLINKRCELEVTHSLYFKEFEQRFNYFNLKDKYDVVLLDEVQDSNMVTLSVFNQFNAKRVMVGDSHQKIYGFRGAIDAMEKFESDATLKEEINLFYVAVTRAKKDIAMPPKYYSMFDKDVMIVIE